MIARLNGILIEKTSTYAVIDCGGVGYLANISVNTSDQLPETGVNVKLISHLIPREDSLNLYGFYDKTEKEAFLLLVSISGIGPKSALGILSSVSVVELQEYILTGNISALNKMPGVGKKTAERLIIELKDKISSIETGVKVESSGINTGVKEEAIDALMTLGFTNASANKAVKTALSKLGKEDIGIEDIIRTALKLSMK